ncbi:MAG: P-loop domain-containing protein [Ktedonobacteraceae bacterium]
MMTTDTKLILIEGIPGSGKSTLAQFITHTLTRRGIVCKWWYEEEKDHPLYVFHDAKSLQQTIEALSDGRYHQIIEAALGRWQAFAQELQSSESVVILDGCLFGYLTWSLFPLDIPAEEIQTYLSQVEQSIQRLQPCLIYLYQQDTPHALEKICERRGGDTRSRLIDQATQSPYGERRKLQGFDGMVTYWKDFRSLIEAAFSRFDASKFALENSMENWSLYERNVLEFLGIPEQEQAAITSSLLKHFVGTYSFEEDESQHACRVLLEKEHLIVDGMPQVWPRTRLIPWSHNLFAIESLPFQVTFEEDIHGFISVMRATGPELLFGAVDRLFVRVQEPHKTVED